SHTVFFQGAAVFDGSAYQTPLGTVPVNTELARKLGSIHPAVFLSSQGHAVGAARGEHALEVQLPFLQVVLGEFTLIPVVMGEQEPETTRALGEALAAVLKGTNSLLVASTDLSHYHSEKVARTLDGAVRKAIESFDAEQVITTIEQGRGEACGGGPVAATLLAAKRLGGKGVKVIDYSTSGAVTGDLSEVVGYLSAIAYGDVPAAARKPETERASAPVTGDELTDEDKQMLKRIAREAIFAHLDGRTYKPEDNERLRKEKGVFVTLTVAGELRGCIGLIKARMPLNEAVALMAVEAAFDDPRFPPMTREEIERAEIEISVLSPLERVHDLSKIKVGRDGLMIKLDMHSGLLLPQVAAEHGWSVTEFLEQTCLKAGLPRQAYKNKFAEIYKFTADVF
ncbi:MAG: AmmeMemoRadiSam system protein A, partial [Candidatus Zixiibacteriota bacterium]